MKQRILATAPLMVPFALSFTAYVMSEMREFAFFPFLLSAGWFLATYLATRWGYRELKHLMLSCSASCLFLAVMFATKANANDSPLTTAAFGLFVVSTLAVIVSIWRLPSPKEW
jgi:hypothetical protein